MKVAVVDHRFANLEPEAEVLGTVGATVVDLNGLPADEVVRQAADADAVLLGARFQFGADRLARLERCRAIVRYGVGVDNVDLDAASARGIAVGCVPDYCVEEVSNHAIALLLALHRQLMSYDARARASRLGIDAEHPIRRLSGLALAILGFGRIGREVARKARALELRVLVHDPLIGAADVEQFGAEPRPSIDDALKDADIVTLHMPLTPATRRLIDARRLRRGAILINVGRDGLVDEDALAAALEEGHLAGAGLDVTAVEPLPPGHRLLAAPNLLLTPHVAWYSTGAQRELQVKAAEEVARVLRGEPLRHPVSALPAQPQR